MVMIVLFTGIAASDGQVVGNLVAVPAHTGSALGLGIGGCSWQYDCLSNHFSPGPL